MKRNFCLISLSLLASCSAPQRSGGKEPKGPQMTTQLEIVPAKWRDDAMQTLGIRPSETSLGWQQLAVQAERKKYGIYRDEFDPAGGMRITAGWAADRSVYRSYRISIDGEYVKKIEAKYAFSGP